MTGPPSDLPSDAWYAVGGSADLGPGAVRAVSLFDRDLVLWRGRSGRVQAWDNRCPHRGLRLSLGMVRGDRLVCRYHGWHYRADGQCDEIPAHPGMTPSKQACVPTHAAHDDGVLLWVCLGGAQAPEIEETKGTAFCRSIALPCEATALVPRLSQLVFLPARLDDATEADRPWRYRVVEQSESMLTALWSRTDEEQRVTYRSESSGPGLTSLTAEGEGLAVETRVLALQPTGPGCCVLHLAVAREDGDAARPAVAAWATRLRWFLESDSRAVCAYTPFAGEGQAA